MDLLDDSNTEQQRQQQGVEQPVVRIVSATNSTGAAATTLNNNNNKVVGGEMTMNSTSTPTAQLVQPTPLTSPPPVAAPPPPPSTDNHESTTKGDTEMLLRDWNQPSHSSSNNNNNNRQSATTTLSNLAAAGPPTTSMSCFWTILRFCNTFAVTILAVVVTLLFMQVQYLTYTVEKEVTPDIIELQEKVQYQQQDQIEQLNSRVEEEHSLVLYQMAATFTVLTCLLTMFHMSSHIRSYHQPIVQRKILVILWMSPIYSITSFCSLVFPSTDGYLAVIKDFFEAYVVYNFLAFLVAVLGRGDREVVVDKLAVHADHLEKPASCLSIFFHPPPETSAHAMANAVLLECQLLALQFVMVRPFTSIFSFVASTIDHNKYHGSDDDQDRWAYFKSPNFYIAMVTNVSVFFAFTGLLKFYHAVRDQLKWCQPFSKFMAIKGIVFLTFWQGLLIAIIVQLKFSQDDEKDTSSSTTITANSGLDSVTTNPGGSHRFLGSSKSEDYPHEQSERIQNFLICLEMLFFSIAHWCVFPAEEWEPNYRPKNYAMAGLGLKDFVSDMNHILSARRARRRHHRRRKGPPDDASSHHKNNKDGSGGGMGPRVRLESNEGSEAMGAAGPGDEDFFTTATSNTSITTNRVDGLYKMAGRDEDDYYSDEDMVLSYDGEEDDDDDNSKNNMEDIELDHRGPRRNTASLSTNARGQRSNPRSGNSKNTSNRSPRHGRGTVEEDEEDGIEFRTLRQRKQQVHRPKQHQQNQQELEHHHGWSVMDDFVPPKKSSKNRGNVMTRLFKSGRDHSKDDQFQSIQII